MEAALPSGAVVGAPTSYLAVRQSEQSNVAPWVPFIIAFGVIALVISVLIVVNVVGGAVVAGTTRIGVLKSIGFTPAQVVACYVLLVAVPAVIGAVVGVVCGNLLAAPIYAQNAQVYQVGVLGVPFWVDVAVPLTVLVLTVAAAVGPASRAGSMSAVQAIATGRAPRPKHGFFAQRALVEADERAAPGHPGLRVARRPAGPHVRHGDRGAVRRGGGDVRRGPCDVAEPRLQRHLRRGAAAGAGQRAAAGRDREPRRSRRPGQARERDEAKRAIAVVGPGAPQLTAAQQHAITTAIDAQPGTLHYLTQTNDNLEFPGLGTTDGGAQITAYGDGDPAWSNLAADLGHVVLAVPGRPRRSTSTRCSSTDTCTARSATCTRWSTAATRSRRRSSARSSRRATT